MIRLDSSLKKSLHYIDPFVKSNGKVLRMLIIFHGTIDANEEPFVFNSCLAKRVFVVVFFFFTCQPPPAFLIILTKCSWPPEYFVV